MRFIFDRDLLLKEIGIVKDVVVSHAMVDIKSTVLLELKEETLTIKARGGKIEITSSITVCSEEAGSAIVCCQKLYEILLCLPSGESILATIGEADEDIDIKSISLKRHYTLRRQAKDTFPSIGSDTGIMYISVPIAPLKEAIDHTMYSVSLDESRYWMMGVLFENIDNKFRLVATDGKRLGLDTLPITMEGDNFSAIVPTGALDILLKDKSHEGCIDIGITEKRIYFKRYNYMISAVLIDGLFPEYRRVIDGIELPYRAIVDRADMIDAINSAKPMLLRDNSKIYLSIAPGYIHITVPENELGNVDIQIDTDYEGDSIEYAFRYEYLLAAFTHSDSEKVAIVFSSNTQQQIRVLPRGDDRYMHLVMPSQK